jgi:predicted RNase H-like nuclease (RuvC/YqgF family)
MDNDVMDAIKGLREDIKKLDRKVEEFRASYDHHAAQEARVHSELRENSRKTLVDIARANGGIDALNKEFTRIDEHIEVLEGTVH